MNKNPNYDRINTNDFIEGNTFIPKLLRERFDYTEWRKTYFADMDLETLHKEAVEYGKAHPFCGKKI